MDSSAKPFTGCMLGLATGDALGAPYEGGPLERLLWRLIGRTSDGCRRWTDDTQMAIDLAESLLTEGRLNPDAFAKRLASSYSWSRGYGPGAARVLRRIRRGEPWDEAAKHGHAGGSYGNGAAMRAPVLALFFPDDPEPLVAAARLSAGVTHAHPLGIEGAVMIATAAQALLRGSSGDHTLQRVEAVCALPEMTTRLDRVHAWIASDYEPSPREVATILGNGSTAATSCPTALYVAIRHLERPFTTMMEFLIACRGDVDTLASMAGALWGIVNGPDHLPPVRLEARDSLLDIAERLFRRQSEGTAGRHAAEEGSSG
ncbi:MAG: ADP-ribosylglycohydrolase family protein [Planctomycetia bacterium]